jgi:ribosomal protein L32E
MKNQKFLRLGYTQYSKLGLRRKKKLTYRRANGIDNKVRLKMKGHLRNVNIGFRKKKEERGVVKGLKLIEVKNMKELKKITKQEIAVLGRFGNKKKMEIAEYALKNNIQILNLNPKKFIEKIKEKLEKRKEEKKEIEERKKSKDKRAKESEKKKEEAKAEERKEIEKVEEKVEEAKAENKEEGKQVQNSKNSENLKEAAEAEGNK